MSYPNPTGNIIGSFQTRVNIYNPIGVEGDFASANPRASALTPDGGSLIAGPNGVLVGAFAWVEADGRTVNSFASGAVVPTGFVHRDQQGLLTQYLQAAGTLIPPGFPVTLMVAGDFLDLIAGGSSSVFGSSCYARYSDGALFIGAAPTGTTGTGSIGSTNTASLGATFTAAASVASTNLVITSVTGLISIGDTVSGSGIVGGQTIVSQASGTTGGAGTYVLSAVATCTGGTVTCFGHTLNVTASTGLVSVGDTVSGGAGLPVGATVTAVVSGGGIGAAGVYTLSAPGTAYTASATGVTTFGSVLNVTATTANFAVGDAITGTGVPAGATIASQVSGTPGQVGIYTLNIPATAYAASTALAVVAGILTKWVAKTAANVGELTQISTWGN